MDLHFSRLRNQDDSNVASDVAFAFQRNTDALAFSRDEIEMP